MSEWRSILRAETCLDLDQPEAFFAAVPARWCVALLVDAAGEPLQLVCAKNLRAMLRRRLEQADPSVTPSSSKRVDYRALVRRVAWERVDSELQMDLTYIAAARGAFPQRWRRLIPDRAVHFVHIDPEEPHPDWVRQESVLQTGQMWGPFPDRSKAERWIQLVRDAFDLCRYRNILMQTPDGKACAYKQMNKCPAPCDGTISMEAYRQQVRDAIQAVLAPASVMESLQTQMRQHVADLAFEKAGKVKSRASTIEQLCSGVYQGVRPLGRFRFVSVQPGPRKGTARIYVCTASGASEVACVLDTGCSWAEIARVCERALPASDWPAEVTLGTIAFYVGNAKTSARFCPEEAMTSDRFAQMLASAMKPVAASQDDGAIRESGLAL
jgi:hypothetical protein